MLLDTTGGYLLDSGLPGTRASDAPWAISTFVNQGTTGTKNAAGGIDGLGTVDFGVAVADGTGDNGIVPFYATNASQKIRGITSRLAHMAATLPGNVIGYPPNAELGIYTMGEANCLAAEAVSKDDGVIALSTPYTSAAQGTTNLGGKTGGVANGNTRIAMANHRWKADVAQGAMGVVIISGPANSALTS